LAAGFGGALILFSFSRVLWLSAALLVPVGFCMMIQMASSNTLIQSIVPDHFRGRVMSVYAMMFLGMTPFGALLAGVLAHPFGAPATVAIGGSVCLAASAVFAWRLPGLRPFARQLLENQQGLVPDLGQANSGMEPVDAGAGRPIA
jgi:MFS family permease